MSLLRSFSMIVFGVGLAPAPVAAEEQLTFDVSGGVSAARNPFLQSGTDTAAAGAFVQVDPKWRWSDEISTIDLGGSARLEGYSRRYDENLSGRFGLNATHRLSPRTKLRSSASVQISRSSGSDFIPASDVPAPLTAPLLTLPDVTVAGSASRAIRIAASAGADHEVNAREGFALDLEASSAQFARRDQSDYRIASASVAYRRLLSERTWSVASLRVATTDYLGRNSDDGYIVSPSLGVVMEVGPRLSLEGSGGVSFTRIRLAGGGHASQTVPAFRVKLCERIERGSTCLSAGRESQPTALSGLTTVTNFGAATNLRLNRRDEFGASLGFTLTDRNPVAGTAAPGADLLAASATYTRSFDRRFAVFVSPSYSRIYDSQTPRRANPAVRFGIRYRFGTVL